MFIQKKHKDPGTTKVWPFPPLARALRSAEPAQVVVPGGCVIFIQKSGFHHDFHRRSPHFRETYETYIEDNTVMGIGFGMISATESE